MTIIQPFSVVFRGLKVCGYKAILVDPPWHFRARTALQVGNWTSRRDAEKHYKVMAMEDILSLPVRWLAHDDGCHLFLWCTGPMLAEARDVMKAWGFRYSGVAFTWVKLRKSVDPAKPVDLSTCFHTGLGLTTRKNAEFVLLGRRGNCKRKSRKVRELVVAPRREHSRKPDEVPMRIAEYCDGPYVDLFARERRHGWDSWGDELNKFG